MENNKGNGFGNGLLIGALIGGAVVFAFGTKKGRKILKALTEEGLEGVSEINDLIHEYEEGDEEFEDEEPESVSSVKEEKVVEAEMVEDPPKKAPHPEKSAPSSRRFFKRKR